MNIVRLVLVMLLMVSCSDDDDFTNVTTGDLIGKWMFSNVDGTSNVEYVFNSDYTLEVFEDSNSIRVHGWSLHEPIEGGPQYQSLSIIWNKNNDNWSSYELISFKNGVIKMKSANSSLGISYGSYTLTKIN